MLSSTWFLYFFEKYLCKELHAIFYFIQLLLLLQITELKFFILLYQLLVYIFKNVKRSFFLFKGLRQKLRRKVKMQSLVYLSQP